MASFLLIIKLFITNKRERDGRRSRNMIFTKHIYSSAILMSLFHISFNVSFNKISLLIKFPSINFPFKFYPQEYYLSSRCHRKFTLAICNPPVAPIPDYSTHPIEAGELPTARWHHRPFLQSCAQLVRASRKSRAYFSHLSSRNYPRRSARHRRNQDSRRHVSGTWRTHCDFQSAPRPRRGKLHLAGASVRAFAFRQKMAERGAAGFWDFMSIAPPYSDIQFRSLLDIVRTSRGSRVKRHVAIIRPKARFVPRST